MRRFLGTVVAFLLLTGLLGTAIFSYHSFSAGTGNQIFAAVPALNQGHLKPGALGTFACNPTDPNDNPPGPGNDDTAAGANPLTPSLTGNAFDPATSWNDTVCTPGSTANDTDWFTFNVTAGTSYSVGLSANGAYTPTLQIAGPGTSQPNGGYTGSLISFSFTANANGTVIMSVSNAGGPSGTGDPTYQYTVGVGQIPPASTATPTGLPTITPTPSPTSPSCTVDSYEPDDYLIGYRLTPATPPPPQNELFVDGSAQFHTIYTSTVGRYDVDWAYFYANTGKPFTVFTSNLGGGLDTYMELWDDSGNKIASNDDSPAGGTLASLITFNPTYTGRYWVMVRDTTRRNSCSFSYNLNLTSSGVPTPTPTGIPSATTTAAPVVCADAYDPSGVPAAAHNILIGEVQDHIFCPAGEADWVKFFALAGKQYTLTTQNLGIGVDTKLYLFDTDGTTLITYNDDFGGTLASQVILIPQVDGIYYAQVKNAGDIGGPTQTYQLKLVAGAITSPATPTVAGTPTTGSGGTPTPTTSGGSTPTASDSSGTPTPTPTTFLQATDTPVLATPTSGPATTDTPVPPAATDTPAVPPTNTPEPPTNTAVPTPTQKVPGLPKTGGGGGAF